MMCCGLRRWVLAHQRALVVGVLIPALFAMGGNPLAQAATTLDHFELKTVGNSVQLILYTDAWSSYWTQEKGQGFSVILEDAKLSEALVQSGLPVVVDNQNRFIGRAVPMDGNRVKIVLPNVIASQYRVEVQQKQIGGNPTVAKSRPPALQSEFKSVASHIAPEVALSPSVVPQHIGLKPLAGLSPQKAAPAKPATRTSSHRPAPQKITPPRVAQASAVKAAPVKTKPAIKVPSPVHSGAVASLAVAEDAALEIGRDVVFPQKSAQRSKTTAPPPPKPNPQFLQANSLLAKESGDTPSEPVSVEVPTETQRIQHLPAKAPLAPSVVSLPSLKALFQKSQRPNKTTADPLALESSVDPLAEENAGALEDPPPQLDYLADYAASTRQDLGHKALPGVAKWISWLVLLGLSAVAVITGGFFLLRFVMTRRPSAAALMAQAVEKLDEPAPWSPDSLQPMGSTPTRPAPYQTDPAAPARPRILTLPHSARPPVETAESDARGEGRQTARPQSRPATLRRPASVQPPVETAPLFNDTAPGRTQDYLAPQAQSVSEAVQRYIQMRYPKPATARR